MLILGEEQSGKTSLLKILFDHYFRLGMLPVLMDGSDINSSDASELIKKCLNKQYIEVSIDGFLNDTKEKILLIDNYELIRLNDRYHVNFLNSIKDIFNKIIIIADSSFKYDEFKYIEFADFSLFEMLLFGNLRRGDLIDKWNSIGVEETIDEVELHNKNDKANRHVDSILRKGIVPRKPFYILTILQFLDLSSASDFSLTSYGHCYQTLIQNAMEKAKLSIREYDVYVNYLEEISYFIFAKDSNSISSDEYEEFKISYSKKFILPSTHKIVLNNLVRAGILKNIDNRVCFGYRYFFYFYAAKYLADHVTECKKCKNVIENLCENIHTERNANVLIFLVHHSKDNQIIDEILLNAYMVFDNVNEAKLDKEDTDHLIEYISTIPSLVIEQKNVDVERKSRLKLKDNIEGVSACEEDLDHVDESKIAVDDNKILTDINKSLRLVDLIGQILRNRYGSLTRDQLLDLSRAAYGSGLKFLNFFLELTKDGQDQIIGFIHDIFKKNTEFSELDIGKEARKLFLILCYGTSFTVIKKISNSLGSDKLIEVFDIIASENEDSPAKQLINIAIKLEFTKKIPKTEITKLHSKLEGNPIAKRLLQEVVIQHLYLNHVKVRERQWIASTLNLPMKSQRLIQNKAR